MNKQIFLGIFSFMLSFSLSAQKTSGSLLVANKADSTVTIFDLSSGNPTALIPVGGGPHEIATSQNGKIAIVCNYGSQVPGNTVSIIDIEKKQVIKTINLGEYKRPHGVAFINAEEAIITSEAQKALIKVHINSGAVSLVAKTDQLTSHMVAYSATDQMAYVANIASGTVSVINVSTNTLIKNIPFKKGIEGLAVSPDGKELWVANREDSTVTAVHTGSGAVLGVMMAHQVAYRVKFLPNGKYVLVSNGLSGNVSVYNVEQKKWIKDIFFNNAKEGLANIVEIQDRNNIPMPVGMAVSSNGQFAYVALGRYNLVAVINTRTWQPVQLLQTGNNPDGMDYAILK